MKTPPRENTEKDKETKKRLVADTVASLCIPGSPHQIFREIGRSIEKGEKLKVHTLTGGLTNYSYKVYLPDSPETALFAKLSFPYALWNPDRDAFYDVKRTVNEFEMMRLFGSMTPGCVPAPYHCVELDDMMLLITQWCEDDEQFASQMIEGVVDARIAPKLARSVAKLHCSDKFDPEFNTNVRPCMLTAFPTIKKKLEELLDSTDTACRAGISAKELGRDLCYKIVERSQANYVNDRDCLVHGDIHVFNILVEKKPNAETLSSLGANVSVSLCDWEMAFAGPIGRDIGIFNAFPIACAVAHAMNGHGDAAKSILDFLDLVWDEYADALASEGDKREGTITKTHRNIVAWCGWFLFWAYYTLNAHVSVLPINWENKDERDMIMDSIGVLSLKFMEWGFGDHESYPTLSSLRSKCREAVEKEVQFALLTTQVQKKRRSSALRVSDAALRHVNAVRSC